MRKFHHYYNLLRYLRKNIKFSYPLSVRRVNVPTDRNGDCQFKNNKFYIRIDKKSNELLAIETLIHELSHALSWENDKHSTDHGPQWGLAYSKVYRKYLEWLKQ